MTYDIRMYGVIPYDITYDVMTYNVMTYDAMSYDIMTYIVMTDVWSHDVWCHDTWRFMKFVTSEIINFANGIGKIYLTDKYVKIWLPSWIYFLMIFCRFLGYQFTKYGHYVFSISEGDLNKRNGPLNKVFPKVNIIIPISLISYLLKSDRTDRAFGKKLAYWPLIL